MIVQRPSSLVYRLLTLKFLLFTVFLVFALVFHSEAKFAGTDTSNMVVDTADKLDYLEQEDIYVGPSIEVNVAARHLKLFDGKGRLLKIYPIAIGMGNFRTPLGPRKMVQIVWNPWWIPPKNRAWTRGERDTPPGPRNPLGPVKMNLQKAILFHGTNKPKTIGHARSHGCMRMYSPDAIELAMYIQKNITDKKDVETFEKYSKYRRRSFYVKLDRPVPVNVIYDIVEVKDKKLYVYRDPYWKVHNKIKVIEDELKGAGYKVKKFDWKYIKIQLKNNKNKTDMTFEIEDLLKKNRKKMKRVGPIASVRSIK